MTCCECINDMCFLTVRAGGIQPSESVLPFINKQRKAFQTKSVV